jgi:hypothetical protein
VFKDASDSFPERPTGKLLPLKKTQFWQLGAIYEDEGTISGTYGVHESIFLKQLGLQAPDDPVSDLKDDFKERLFLVHGDQVTTHRIRAVRAAQQRAARPYDRRNWLLGIPAWFHIQYNLVNMLIRTHWKPNDEKQEAHHCLKHDVSIWNRSFSSRDKLQYNQMDKLLSQSYRARVSTLFFHELRKQGLLRPGEGGKLAEHAEVESAIEKLSPKQFCDALHAVQRTAFTRDAWLGRGCDDIEFTTMCRLLQEIELFLVIRYAVKTGDVGILRYVVYGYYRRQANVCSNMVDPLIVHFFGSGQHNYGREMLYYRWLLSDACDPVLQDAILGTGLVNWTGKPDHWKGTDQGQEHMNLQIATSFRNYKNSTHDTDIVFDRICLTSSATAGVRTVVERAFGEHMPGSHSIASTRLDTFMLSSHLFNEGLMQPRTAAEIARFESMFESKDILTSGMQALSVEVAKFNQEHVQEPGQVAATMVRPVDPPNEVDVVSAGPQGDLYDLEDDDFLGADMINDEDI